MATDKPPPRTENTLMSLGCNVALPALLLGKGDDWLDAWLNPTGVLAVALAFPVGYFIWDYCRRRQASMISIIGFLGTLASGGLGLLKMDPFWVAVKEAAVPVLIGVVFPVADWLGRPLVRTVLFNEAVFDLPRVLAAVAARGNTAALNRKTALASRLLAGSFVLSGALNFTLARLLVKTHPQVNAVAFNQELGKMALWSWPVIVLPMMAVFVFALLRLFKAVQRLSGLSEAEIFRK